MLSRSAWLFLLLYESFLKSPTPNKIFSLRVRDAGGNVLHYYFKINDTFIQGDYPIYGAGRLGMAFRYPDHLKYVYEFTDHQGNVRQVFTKLKYMAVATMETTEPNKTWEETPGQGGFLNLDTRHQDQIVNTTPEGSHSAWLNPVQNGKAVGPAKELEVKAGDKIKMSVNAAYLIPNSDNQIVSSFSSVLAYAMGFDPNINETAAKFNAIDGAAGGLAAVAKPDDPRQPKAYLQYLFFDKDLNYIPPATGVSYDSVSTVAGNTATELQNAAQVKHEELTLEYTAPEDGYMFIYVANESENDVSVWFDDLTIQQLGLDVLQATDFYPFGLVLERYKKENYAYGYQGQFAEEDTITGWNSFELRMYYPVIARWTSPDPYGQFYSPYLAMGNNPAGVDPDGGCTVTVTNSHGTYEIPCPGQNAGELSQGASGAGKALGETLMIASSLAEAIGNAKDVKSMNGSISDYEFQIANTSNWQGNLPTNPGSIKTNMEIPHGLWQIGTPDEIENRKLVKERMRVVVSYLNDPRNTGLPWNQPDFPIKNYAWPVTYEIVSQIGETLWAPLAPFWQSHPTGFYMYSELVYQHDTNLWRQLFLDYIVLGRKPKYLLEFINNKKGLTKK